MPSHVTPRTDATAENAETLKDNGLTAGQFDPFQGTSAPVAPSAVNLQTAARLHPTRPV
jgi:hypothetical protein